MSERIPESIPTSMDPRSQRVIKKRALSPASQQSAALTTLFKNPDRNIALPASTALTNGKPCTAPPEIVANVQGSSAGAGSGEFHVYKASRRREYERLKQMDEEVRLETEKEEFESKAEELRRKDEERTEKNRRKRNKNKKGWKKNEGGASRNEKGVEVKVKDGEVKRTEGDGDKNATVNAVEDAPVVSGAGVVIFDDD